MRKLSKDGGLGLSNMENGDYLLNFFSKNARDDAIERAVLIANSDPAVEKVVENLDRLAASAQKV